MERQAGRYRQGGGGNTGELFDDLDYFLLLQEYPQRYMPLLDFKDERFRAGRMSLRGDWRESVRAIPSSSTRRR
jgi:hypothetical protein